MTSAFFFIWCQVFRRAQEPQDKEHYEKSYFNLLIEYDSKAAREELPGTFEYLQVNIWKSWVLRKAFQLIQYRSVDVNYCLSMI